MKFWLMKSEPSTYSIDTLIKKPNKTDAENRLSVMPLTLLEWQAILTLKEKNTL